MHCGAVPRGYMATAATAAATARSGRNYSSSALHSHTPSPYHATAS